MAPPRKGSQRGGLTRRTFVHRLTFFGGGVVLLGAGCKKVEPDGARPAPRKGPLTTSHLSFTNAEFDRLGAACERILPKDEAPGALEAHVPTYIDRALQTPELAHMREDVVAGLEALERRSRAAYGKTFVALEPAQQDALLTAFKDAGEGSAEASFYELLLVLTLEGFLGDPSYGGNHQKVGWALVGFEMHHHGAAEPPKGYSGAQQLQRHKGH